MIYPLVAQLAAGGIAVTITCRVLKVARQPYCRWLSSPVSDRDLHEAHLVNALHDAHRDDPEFGYRFLGHKVRAAGENAAMESFYALLQQNVLSRRTWETREDIRIAIVTWIERTYDRRRRQERLRRLTPVEYETIMTTQVALAA